ncbi:hypothetical protein IC229_04450 [Spirosoma sp. BT702]|uniref:Iodothyronine deiodinase n=1 Tax=Spirosoma profusum TaxID=2771354 RepID=A0A926XXZ7_9BACT|nr:deiodinase-like protein [Spirosoma profusum]MBD2699873.1 hypothetical protein [Spirosoma profusum]
MKLISYLFSLLLVATLCSCQTSYNVSRGNSQLPKDEATVNLPVSEGIKNNYRDFEKLGYQKGAKISDLTLYSPDGVKFNTSEILAKGKPLLLISGSYTCDISRHNLLDVNALTARYKDKASIYLIYTIDAHPSDVASPYSQTNQVSLAKDNIREHIEAKQAKTYGERKTLAQKWKQQNNILAPVVVDKPTNDFWLAYGQAPNMAYFIEPDGTVFYKQAWFKYVNLDNAIKEWLRSHS